MTDSRNPDVSSASPARTLVVLGALAIAGFFVYRWQSSPARQDLPKEIRQIQKENETLRRELVGFRDRMAEMNAEDLMNAEEKALLQAGLLQLASDGDEAQRYVDDFSEQVAQWQQVAGRIARPEVGGRIAAEEAATVQYRALRDEERPPAELASRLDAELESLLVPIRQALDAENAVYSPGEGLKTRIAEIKQQAAAAAEVYRGHNARLKAILAAAPAQAPPGTPPLEEAVARLESRWAAEQNQRIEAAVREVRDADTQRLAQLKAQAQKQIDAAKEQAQRDEAARALKRIQDSEEEARIREQQRMAERDARLQREKLEADFQRELPEIRKYLAAFMYEGYTQPNNGAYHQPTAKKGPMSLSAIRSASALQESELGLTRFNFIVTGNLNDRPSGGFPAFYGGRLPTSSVPFLSKAQGYLRKYGELMVEQKMLAP